MFCFLFCVFCVLFLLLYILVYFLFVYKFTDYCHPVETQLQVINVIPIRTQKLTNTKQEYQLLHRDVCRADTSFQLI